MSKTLRTVAVIAGAVALTATGLGAAGVIGAKAAATISGVSSVVGAAASIGAQLTQPLPPAHAASIGLLAKETPP